MWVCVFCSVNDFTTTFTQCLATDLNTVLCNRTVKCGLPSVSEHCLFKLSYQMECNRTDDVSTHIFQWLSHYETTVACRNLNYFDIP